jgi:MraZ protein
MMTTLDDRGRVSLPADFREGHARLFITNEILPRGERRLMLFAPHEWGNFLAHLRERSATDNGARLKEIFYVGHAHELVIDRQGRVLIPPRLLKFAGLTQAVAFAAKPDHLELWAAGGVNERGSTGGGHVITRELFENGAAGVLPPKSRLL